MTMAANKNKAGYDGKIAGLYDLEYTIGQGHYAVVKLARHVFTGEKVAVKVIDKTKLDEVSKAHLFQEVRCMKLVQHPHVVRLYEVIDTQTKLYLILELGDGGDMYDYIMKQKGLDEDVARMYFKQIVEAIAYCHRLHVVHRDLKPENVVFFKKQGLVKLTDFGFSNMFKPGKKLDTSCGSLAYSAPEILLGDSYDAPAVDIWSLGVILYMLVCGQPPFQEANDSETLTMIMDCKYHLPAHISADCRNLISRMLMRNPSDRLTLEEIIADLWLHMSDTPAPMITPLISLQDLCDEDHNSVIQRMVDGNIASREDILSSIEKDSYDHITSTYYLLAERRLKKQISVQRNAEARNVSTTNSPSTYQGSSKPSLEPLALSPRTLKELKKARTAPVKSMQPPWPRYPGTPSAPLRVDEVNTRFVSLTLSKTLDRRVPASPRKPLKNGSDESTKKQQTFSKIAALKSFFERKAAALMSTSANSALQKVSRKSASKKDVVKKQFGSRESSCSSSRGAMKRVSEAMVTHNIQPKQSRDESSKVLIESLLSPQSSVGQQPISEAGDGSLTRKKFFVRKYSLIHEESIDEEDDAISIDVDVDDLRPAKSLHSVDDGVYPQHHCGESGDQPQQRSLTSIASSPLLLKQINEEGESDNEDDLVPTKINSHEMIARQHISPDVVKKLERRRRRGAGQRGTSCSSSDASDTDDTESRSRKEKLKHKIVHRRDSGDHSSDTDGPGGPGPGGSSVGGAARFGASSGGVKGGGNSHSRGNTRDSNSANDNNNNNSNNSGRKHGDFNQGTLLSVSEVSSKKLADFLNSSTFRANKKSSDISVTSTLSSLSLASLSSKNSYKYVYDEESDKNGTKLSHVAEVISREFSGLSDRISLKDDRQSVCSFDRKLSHLVKSRSADQVKTDINCNGLSAGLYAKQPNNGHVTPLKYDTKCCAIV